MFTFLCCLISILLTYCNCEITHVVQLDDGAVQGRKYWDGNFYEFYGVPYATAPTGRDKFKAPLPVTKRDKVLQALKQSIMCQQTFYTEDDDEDPFMVGQEDCLTMNIFVPTIANKTNLLPVVAYIHSGAFAGGNGNMGRLLYLTRRDVIAVSLNYRVGALGFACLGTEEIPGNAALKDQLAALKWINRNIQKFGGDSKKVTLAGYSVGAAMAELLAISKETDGLIDKLILESGSALSPYAVNRDPIATAKNIAISIGYKGPGNIKDLNEFYLKAPMLDLALSSIHFYLTNSTFGFAPCIERTENNPQPFLTESPMDILRKGEFKQLPVLTGFANMEGLSRVSQFGDWIEMMNKDFRPFLPADLTFKQDEIKSKVALEIKKHYFKDEEITFNDKQSYIDYFSDSMFKYSILKSVNLYAEVLRRPLYVYEFSYKGELNMKHIFMDTIKGASHRDQTAYVLDFYSFTNVLSDLNTRDRMIYLWTDFIKFENPTAYESLLLKVKWRPYTKDNPYYMSIGNELIVKKDDLMENYQFWNNIYSKYYWNPNKV